MATARNVFEVEAAAHTAEHVFIRSLQNLGVSLVVHRVDHEGSVGKVTLEAEGLTWPKVIGASVETNRAIMADLPVTELKYEGLEDAVKAHPLLRARGDRVEGQVRVIKIGDYDVATCTHAHSRTTSSARFFLVTDMRSLAGGEVEVCFAVGEGALKALSELLEELVEASEAAQCKPRALPSNVRRLQSQVRHLRRALGAMTAQLVRSIAPSARVGPADVYAQDVGEALGHVLQREVGELLKSGQRIYVISYSEAGQRSYLLARSDDVPLDCPSVLRQTLEGLGGRCGGKANFAMGGAPHGEPREVLARITRQVAAELGAKS